MRIVRFILACIFGFCCGLSATLLFHDRIGLGLGIFVIGNFFAVFYITAWLYTCYIEKIS